MRHFQKGFTLLEVLIAILVLSFGLLGLAAMQLNALQSAHFSYQGTIANLAAKDVKERIWAKLLELQEKEEDGEVVSYVACPSSAENPPSPSRLSRVMDDANVEWRDKLPEMEVVLTEKVGTSCGYTVEIYWLDERFGTIERDEGDGLYSRYVYHVHLPGQAFVVK
ncbi:type IV pilus modification protein PilV [Halomonas sp. JS92-SW72]|nr:type IV pilus modification protein PilV [Halomonas sp. JS92-SW72]